MQCIMSPYDLCKTEVEYSGFYYDGEIMNIRGTVIAHLQSQKHISEEVWNKNK